MFNNKKNCFLCGTVVLFGHEKHAKRPMKASQVQTREFSVSIKKVLEDRADEWDTQVQGRLEFLANDLRAYDCVYHQKCSVNFRTGKDIPLEFENLSNVRKSIKGRPENSVHKTAFFRVCDSIEENEEEQFQIPGLVNLMQTFLEDIHHTAYSKVYIKTKLKEHFGDRIFISGEIGNADIVTLTDTASSILRHYRKSQASPLTEEEEKFNIIATAAKLIKSDIRRETKSSVDFYPRKEDII